MRALVIDDKAREDIAKLLKYADENRISKPFLIAAVKGEVPSVGDNPNHCCYFKDGFKVVLSIEQQPRGWSKHISVSVNDAVKLPSMAAIELILKEFGMKSIDDIGVNAYIERTNPQAINVISLI